MTLSFTKIILSLSILLSVFHLRAQAQSQSQSTGCWLNAYGRGVGKPLSTCPSGQEQNGALCYPTCSTGFYGVGPVCWESCPSGFTDTGVDCLKPSSYGRGAGYAIWDEGKCNSENSQGCEQYGLLYYPKCQENFHNVGCCVCSPDCPSDMTDIGVSCQKRSYGRGAGNPMICSSNEEEDAGLCYTACDSGYSGVGPVCWGSCPNSMYKCGALCLGSEAECTSDMLNIGLEAVEGVADIASEAEDPVEGAISAAETVEDIAGDLDYPICSTN